MDESTASGRFWSAFIVAAMARLAVVGVVISVTPCDLASYAASADGYQVLDVAARWGTPSAAPLEGLGFLTPVSRGGVLATSHLLRLFPVPAGLIALLSGLGFPAAVAAILPFWLLAWTAAGLVAVWATDHRAGLFVALLPPIYLYSSTLPEGTSWVILASVVGWLTMRRERWLLAGLAFGVAAWSRPEGIFPLVAAAFAFDPRRRWPDLGRVLAGAAISAAAGAAIFVYRWGAIVDEILARGDSEVEAAPSIFAVPGSALIGALVDPATPVWKVPYVFSHVALLVVGMVLLWRASRKPTSEGGAFELRALALWCLLQLVFQLSLRGTQGFDDFPRYMNLVLPALAIGYLRFLPRATGAWLLVALLSLATALDPAVRNSLASCGPSIAATTGGV